MCPSIPHKSGLAKLLLAFGFMFLIANTSVFGQFIFYEFPGSPASPPSVIGPDPSGGVAAPVLTYLLPGPVVSGDVLLAETPLAGQTNLVPSDIIRFFQNPANPNQSIAIFYSDLPENTLEIPDPADVGLPTQLMPVTAGPFTEVGTEGNNSYHYIPTPGMPGSLAGGATVDYLFISDVPEPSSIMLAGIGGGLLLALRWRWTRQT
jgi:hypothetical protein